ncbi:hypothetical protein BH24DEI2_BH24DEI2_05800 [soil metagenome]
MPPRDAGVKNVTRLPPAPRGHGLGFSQLRLEPGARVLGGTSGLLCEDNCPSAAFQNLCYIVEVQGCSATAQQLRWVCDDTEHSVADF